MLWFGRTDSEYSSCGQCQNVLRGGVYSPSQSGTASSITAYISQVNSNPHNWKCAIYKVMLSQMEFLGETEAIWWTGREGWVTFNLQTPIPIEAGVKYGLFVWSDYQEGGDTDGHWYGYPYEEIPGAKAYRDSRWLYEYGFPNDFWPVYEYPDSEFLIYCEYVAEPTDLCTWIDSKGGPIRLTIIDVFVIIDSYLSQSPPMDYSFIPTLQQVFGVIDYYLGFDGDAKTGCDYY